MAYLQEAHSMLEEALRAAPATPKLVLINGRPVDLSHLSEADRSSFVRHYESACRDFEHNMKIVRAKAAAAQLRGGTS